MTLWDPSRITTAAWYDASDTDTITESGGAVSQWGDKSGNDRHFTQSEPTDQATTNATIQNGLNVLDFDGDDWYNGSQPATSEIHIFLVRKTSDDNTIDFNGDGGNDYSFISQSGSTSTSITPNFGTPSLYKNGSLESPSTRDDVYNLLNTGSWDNISYINCDISDWGGVFDLGPGGTSTFNSIANYAEIILVKGTITTETRQTVEGYLAHKWGLAANLPVDHPYKSIAPTVADQNGLVASVDYPNQRIYLGIDSANIRLDTLDVFREVRTLRATTEDHRRFSPIIASGGNVQKTADTATAKFVKLTAGTMIVPYDGDHTTTLIRDTFTEDNLSGTDVFDLTLLSPSTSVQIKEDIPQVEVVTVSTGSGLDDQQSADLIAIKALSDKLDAMIEDVSGNRFTSKALEQAPSGGSGSSEVLSVDTLTVIEGTLTSGGLTQVQAWDEAFAIVNETINGLEVTAAISASDIAKDPSSLKVVGYYKSNSADHLIHVEVYNYDLNSWEHKGYMEDRKSSFEYNFPISSRHQNPSTGQMQLKFIHNDAANYKVHHSLNIDYIGFTKLSTNAEVLSGISQILNNQTQLLNKGTLSTDLVTSSTSKETIMGDSASYVDDTYNYQIMEIVSGTGVGQTRLILDYVGFTKTATLDRDWLVTPDSTSTYIIKAADSSVLSNIDHKGSIRQLKTLLQSLQ